MGNKTHHRRGEDHALALITSLVNRETETYRALLDMASTDPYLRGLIGALCMTSAPVVNRHVGGCCHE